MADNRKMAELAEISNNGRSVNREVSPQTERINFCKNIYEKYSKEVTDLDDFYGRFDVIRDTPDLWINGMLAHMKIP